MELDAILKLMDRAERVLLQLEVQVQDIHLTLERGVTAPACDLCRLF